uniref:RING-type domain-containing protein n=1 Tax=Grammatophora oceanica TaxID=210454 RepID=A0A7S1VM24_9STRA|mmetsp:Transcript_50254/g.75028  ORF Transcript_50254/g.75028 Transcript_50254/m.75028 type:complete len:201 (+) Transcript_50254:157-759(+)
MVPSDASADCFCSSEHSMFSSLCDGSSPLPTITIFTIVLIAPQVIVISVSRLLNFASQQTRLFDILQRLGWVLYHYKEPAASKKCGGYLEIQTYRKLGGCHEDCPICLNEFAPTSQISYGPCGHIFCKECIAQWLDKGEHSCPCCRSQIVTPFYAYVSRSIAVTLFGDDAELILSPFAQRWRRDSSFFPHNTRVGLAPSV